MAGVGKKKGRGLQAQHRVLIQPNRPSPRSIEIGYKRDKNRDSYWRKNQVSQTRLDSVNPQVKSAINETEKIRSQTERGTGLSKEERRCSADRGEQGTKAWRRVGFEHEPPI